MSHAASLLYFAPSYASAYMTVFPAIHFFVRIRTFLPPDQLLTLCPHSSDMLQCRNLNLLSIGYDFRPHLRPRLPQGRSALPWKPWIFGLKDSYFNLATHSGILSSWMSTARFRTASPFQQCSSTDETFVSSPGFGVVFQPRSFSAQDLSTSELLRTLLMCGCF